MYLYTSLLYSSLLDDDEAKRKDKDMSTSPPIMIMPSTPAPAMLALPHAGLSVPVMKSPTTASRMSKKIEAAKVRKCA